MPGKEETPEIAGAICAPPPKSQQNHTANNVLQQPRQPTSLHGLFKFAMETTKNEDAPGESKFLPLDAERRKFLEQALHSLTIDVIEVLLKQIKILENVETLKDGEDASEYITALETISEYVCDIDTANDFYKIGGFMILQPSLKCINPEVRAQSCNLIAELCQNNPFCQNIVLENTFIADLLNTVQKDEDVTVVTKALYAISCIVRDNSKGCSQFIQYGGIQIFLDALKKSHDKWSIKICFLLFALCGSEPDFKSRLIFEGYIPTLIDSITVDRKDSHEQVLGLLLSLIEDNPTAISECRQNNGFKDVLNEYLASIRNHEEYADEVEYCENILNILYPKS